jgi:hypothetical protein
LEELAADALGESLDALLDGALDGSALPGGVGDDHAAFIEELQDPPDGGAGAAAERPDVGLGDGGAGSYPGQQYPQGLGSVVA